MAQNLAQYVKKGQRLLVNGELHIDQFTSKDGNMKYISEVVVSGTTYIDYNQNNQNNFQNQGF